MTHPGIHAARASVAFSPLLASNMAKPGRFSGIILEERACVKQHVNPRAKP
jgi:hypothetical protein